MRASQSARLAEALAHVAPPVPPGRKAPRLTSTHLLVVYLNVVLYSGCYMAQVPVLPYLLKELGASNNRQYGTMQTIFNTVQFFGGLISGPFVDRYGGRSLLAVSFLASILCYGMTATATSTAMVYMSRLPTVLQHAILAARTMVTEMSTDEDRARMLGYIGVSYGLGFAVGPAVGGVMSQTSLRFTAWAATAGSVLSLTMVMLLLPADKPGRSRAAGSKEGAEEEEEAQKRDAHDAAPPKGVSGMLGQFKEVVRQAGVAHMLVAKVLVSLGFAVFQTMFPILLQQQYGMDSKGNGLVLSYVGLLNVAVQATVIGPVTRAFGEARIELVSSWGLLLSFVGLALARSLRQVLVLLVPLSVAGVLYNTLNTSRLTKAVPPSQRGTILALDMSLFSGVRMISPALGAWVVERYGHSGIGACAAALVGALLLALQLRLLRLQAPQQGQRDVLFVRPPERCDAVEADHGADKVKGL